MSPARDVPTQSALEQLVDDSPCLAAVFCSYTFDPRFFENQVLRTVLKLRSDPDEHVSDFLAEGILALQSTPVACFVDAGARSVGQRLPYEQHTIARRVFHPKLAILARAGHVRLLLGSGNLTRGGYGDNTELWSSQKLIYTSELDASLLRELLAALVDIEALAGRRSPAVAELVRVITARLPPAAPPSTASTRHLLHSIHEPILPAFLRLLPAEAQIVQVGVLAPFYERDDADALDPEQVDGVIAQILDARTSAGVIIDMGFTWQGGPLGPPATIPPLPERLGTLWVHRHAADPPTLEYFTPGKFTAKSLRYDDQSGISRTWARDEAEKAWNARALFLAAPCIANGPQRLVSLLSERHTLKAWLYPSLRLEAGRPIKRPLHAKMIAVAVRTAAGDTTYVLAGSPNASRRALMLPGSQANVEFAFAFALAGRWTLDMLAPALVACPLDQITLQTPDFPVGRVDLGQWIELVEYDAQTRELRVHWSEQGPGSLAAHRLVYLGNTLCEGMTPPRGIQVFNDFELKPASCELLLVVDADEYCLPILVINLAALQVDPFVVKYDLAALIALLSRRISVARLRQLVVQRASHDARPLLEELFGEGFTPTDIFRMFLTLARELADPDLSLPAFRHVLQRPTGVRVVWETMRDALGAELSREQLWFYGAELCKTLAGLTLPDDPDRPSKAAELTELIRHIRGELAPFTPDATALPWIDTIVRFYRDAP
jgi:hypothetical protein